MSQSTHLFTGRSFKTLGVRDPVLLVTSPLLVRALLEEELHTPERRKALDRHFVGIMDAVHANHERGVVQGWVTEVGTELDELGLHLLKVEFEEPQESLLNLEEAFAYEDEPRTLAVHVPESLCYNPATFLAEHRWFTKIGLDEEGRNEILVRMSGLGIQALMREEFTEQTLEAFMRKDPELHRALNRTKGNYEMGMEVLGHAMRKHFTQKPCETYQLVLPNDAPSLRRVRAAFSTMVKTIESHQPNPEREWLLSM